jgi:excisionase family DNA binding protein
MVKKKYITIPELARLLGISRVAVYRRVKKGQISAIKVGRMYMIPAGQVAGILSRKLSDKEKSQIDKAVRKVVREYSELLKMLGRE